MDSVGKIARKLTQLEEQQEREADPYTLFVYSLRSPYTKETHFRRLRRFFDSISIDGPTFESRCNSFAIKGRNEPTWAFNCILRFIQAQKERVERKEITGRTCEVTDVAIPWKKISRGLPRAKRYADDRAPTAEEIRRIMQYPDRRIKPIVYTMTSSGIRVGAWDYLKWGHIVPIEKNGHLAAAKKIVYAGEPDEYFTFISPEAYNALESWVEYRRTSGESINAGSWLMRNLWNSLRPTENSLSRKLVNTPKKLNSVGVKRLIERALWTQGLGMKLPNGKKRHEFQTDHGFRKWFKTQSEISGMKPINVEILMGHSVGISDSYYRATENDLLEDYLKAAVDFLTLNNEYKLQKKIFEIGEQSKVNYTELKSELYSKEKQISILSERDSSNSDAIAALSDQVMRLMNEVETLKRKNNHH